MTSITLTGALSLISTNGDGPQMLTEAAEFVNALAQMGVIVGVEINLRPVVQDKPAATLRGYTTAEAAAPAPTPEPPANPQTPSLKEAGVERSWRKIDRADRKVMVLSFLSSLRKSLGHPPTQSEYHAHKPDFWPSATSLVTTFGVSWAELATTPE